MALVIEDGSGVENANSYVTVLEIRTHAEARGNELPVDDLDVEKLAIKAMDYIEGFRARFQGNKSDYTQELQFPRTGVVVDGYYLESTEIPVDLKRAQIQASIESHTTDLMPNLGQAIKKEKIDVIEVEYQDGTNERVSFEKIDSFLGSLLRTKSGWPTRSNRI